MNTLYIQIVLREAIGCLSYQTNIHAYALTDGQLTQKHLAILILILIILDCVLLFILSPPSSHPKVDPLCVCTKVWSALELGKEKSSKDRFPIAILFIF